ncbi:hypothetical protein [Streptomyces chartreusis]
MVTFDPDKKETKRSWWRTLFGLNPAADVRRARLATRDVKANSAKLRSAREERREIKRLRKAGILK